ncbi:MAG: mobile mystery protein B [Saprospiraceae bacterium]|nr:mobile mystery protein B [Saprospiraceae bacterium]
MEINLEYHYGQTPLDEEEKQGLLIASIATQGELDEFEQQNIEQSIQWLWMRPLKPETIFTEKFIREVHRKMYGQVWRWAGNFRKTNKNLGVDRWVISTELKVLLEDALFWVNNNSWPPDEMAVRFKHRLVSIRCFPNGNGRHSRLMADIIIEKIFKQPVFSWGASDLIQQTEPRTTYIKAVKTADAGDIQPLLSFARS